MKCTIAIPVYNRQKLVAYAIESALDQNIADLEVLIIDNCSTDGTWEQINTYQDPRIRCIKNAQNLGLFGNFNRCLDLARGKFLKILCSDDRLTVGSVEKEIEIMECNPQVVMLNTVGQKIDFEGKVQGRVANYFAPGIYHGEDVIYAWFWFHTHYFKNPLNYPSGVLFRRKECIRVGCFDSTMQSLGDVDFYLRLLKQGDLAVSPLVGCQILEHDTQEQVFVMNNGTTMLETYNELEKNKNILLKRGGYHRMLNNLDMITFYIALKLMKNRKPEASKMYYKMIVNLGFKKANLLISMLQVVVLKAIWKLTGYCITKLPRPIPLNKNS